MDRWSVDLGTESAILRTLLNHRLALHEPDFEVVAAVSRANAILTNVKIFNGADSDFQFSSRSA
jgi:hypothetical protein